MIRTPERLGALALLLPALIACESPRPTSTAVGAKDVLVVTDGRFNEWGALPVLIADPEDADADAAVDIGEVRAADDPRWLHLSVDVGRRVNLQRMRGTLRILFDVDGERSTGAELTAMEGVDLIAELSRRDRDPEDGIGAGNGIRPVTASGPGEILTGHVAGLITAPTHSASRFEIRLERGGERGGGLEGLPALFSADTVRMKLVFEDAAGVRDQTHVATHRLNTEAGGAEPPNVQPSIEKVVGTFRVVHWNVAGESLRRRPEVFRRILMALDPDVVLFDEVYESVTREEIESFFAVEPLGLLGPWSCVVGRSGGRQKAVVAARTPIRPAEELLEVAYPSGSLDPLAEEAAGPDFRELLESERDWGVPAAGAWVELGDPAREALLVALDLQSGGYDESPRDRLRELQATTLRGRIAEVAEAGTGGPVPLVVAGDLNLVGSARPLDLLRAGLDAGGAIDLAISEAYRLTDRSQATWRDPEGDFTPGRLDYLLFTASTLESFRAFVFDATELSEGQAVDLGLAKDDSEAASRHLPCVADFRWSRARQ